MKYQDYIDLQDELLPIYQDGEIVINSARQLVELVDKLPALKRVIREEEEGD